MGAQVTFHWLLLRNLPIILDLAGEQQAHQSALVETREGEEEGERREGGGWKGERGVRRELKSKNVSCLNTCLCHNE